MLNKNYILMPPFKVIGSPTPDAAKTNLVYLHPSALPDARHVKAEKTTFTIGRDENIDPQYVGLSAVHRKYLKVAMNDVMNLEPYDPKTPLDALTIDVVTYGKVTATAQFDTDAAATYIAKQQRIVQLNHPFLICNINQIVFVCKAVHGNTDHGVPSLATKFVFNTSQPNIELTGSLVGDQRSIFTTGWTFDQFGVGGLDEQFKTAFRRAFLSRVLPKSLIAQLGIAHVKGILMHGPPGTGKTLMARQICNMLNGKFKMISGPEIMSKYVGQSEENVRALFADAIADQRNLGASSPLHVIVFDEMDAICKQRGTASNGTGVNDSVVNQLLALIDGVDSLNNILLIGMTNRLDMIDEAILRPGRFELKLAIGLPDEHGRSQIIQIHTKTMQTNNMMAPDVDLDQLAATTPNFSGAELAGLVRAAVSNATERCISVGTTVQVNSTEVAKVKVTMDDFTRALQDIKPAFGSDMIHFGIRGIVPWSRTNHIIESGAIQVKRLGPRSPLVTMLVHGEPGSGKSTIVNEICKATKFPFVKLLSAENMIGFSEQQRLSAIRSVFEKAYESSMSCIMIDDIERLIEWVPINNRYSNSVLQMLLVLLKKQPPPNHCLFVVCTTSQYDMCEMVGMVPSFIAKTKMPTIADFDQLMQFVQFMDHPVAKFMASRIFNNHIMESEKEAFEQKGGITIKRLIDLMDLHATSPIPRFWDVLCYNSYNTE